VEAFASGERRVSVSSRREAATRSTPVARRPGRMEEDIGILSMEEITTLGSGRRLPDRSDDRSSPARG
jgi:hypothetical protein